MHTAAGFVAPPVYIIQDSSMPKETHMVTQVTGLSHSCDTTSYGYLVFCNTRACNASFYQWFMETVVIPFFVHARGLTDGTADEMAEMRSFVSCDGEAMQLKVFMQNGVLSLLNENRIDIGKLPASTSGSTQASDVSSYFKAMKTRLKSLRASKAIDTSLHARLDKIIREEHSAFSSEQRKLIVLSLLRITTAASKTVCKDIVHEGYTRTGQFPLDLKQTLACCTNTLVKQSEINTIKREMSLQRQAAYLAAPVLRLITRAEQAAEKSEEKRRKEETQAMQKEDRAVQKLRAAEKRTKLKTQRTAHRAQTKARVNAAKGLQRQEKEALKALTKKQKKSKKKSVLGDDHSGDIGVTATQRGSTNTSTPGSARATRGKRVRGADLWSCDDMFLTGDVLNEGHGFELDWNSTLYEVVVRSSWFLRLFCATTFYLIEGVMSSESVLLIAGALSGLVEAIMGQPFGFAAGAIRMGLGGGVAMTTFEFVQFVDRKSK
eukprot:gene29667-36749_t